MKALNKILEFDPYVNLCSLTLQAIFDEGRQNDEVTEELIRNYSHDYSGDAKTFREIFSNGYDTTVTVDLLLLQLLYLGIIEKSLSMMKVPVHIHVLLCSKGRSLFIMLDS